MDLSNSKQLIRIPNLSKFPKLEVIILRGCTSLVEVSSTKYHGKIIDLDLGKCSKLASLPNSICNLKSLKELDFTDCVNLHGLPENLGDLESLVVLRATRSGIKKLPSSINQLKKLNNLDCEGCEGLILPPFTECKQSINGMSTAETSKHWTTRGTMSGQRDLLCIPGSEMPEWMMYENDNGSSLSFSLTTHSHASDFIKIAFCALVEANCSNFILDGISISCEGRFVTESGECLEMYPNCPLNLIPKIHYISLWYCAIRFNSKKIRIREASFQFFIPGGEVHKCGVHLMFDHNLEHDNVDDDSKRMSLPVLDYRQAMKQGLFFTQFLVAEDDPEQYPLQRLKERHEFKVVDLNFSLSFLFTLVICLAATSDQTKAQPTRMIFTLMLIYVCMRLLSFNSSLSLHGMPN
ncbi:hypothetical protein GH714_007241 [Hevea brasiliensis]|uniref:TMV resistance protein N n=1 Tax=Hevea brasiliensis TaxID=3981 RepID=A0A6A6NA11_HEVBR|nr:hypothetical protein GH714_007241 [Hevea brasiliensis]